MFARRKRLPRKVFPKALSASKRLSSAHFSVALPKEGVGYAVIVPKKVARLSVTRHRIKRRVFAALKTTPLPPSLIVFPKAAAAGLTYQQVQEELAGLLSKISR